MFRGEFWIGNRVCHRLRKVKMMSTLDIALLLVSGLVFVYLLYALVNPEKF